MEGIAPVYRFIVAHLAPGGLALVPLVWCSEAAATLVASAISSDGTVTQGFILLSLALVLGLLIDGLCLVSFEFLVEFLRWRVFGQATALQTPQTTDEFAFIDRINSMHHAWMQLYASSCAIFLFMAVAVAAGVGPVPRWHSVWLFVVSVGFIFASARASANGERLLAAKFGH